MHHTNMLLRAAHVAGIFEGDPGVTSLEQHAQHLAPQVPCGHALEELDLATVRRCFIS
jgi:hypothetical protein